MGYGVTHCTHDGISSNGTPILWCFPTLSYFEFGWNFWKASRLRILEIRTISSGRSRGPRQSGIPQGRKDRTCKTHNQSTLQRIVLVVGCLW